MDKKKLLVITPHLSTGGLPQVTLNKIQLLNDEFIIKCIEHSFVSWDFVVQRNKIISIIGNNFHSLGEDKTEILKIIDSFQPDVISFEEFPEFFLDDSITKLIYKESRNYRIFETTHDSSFPVSEKRFFPDKFHFVSPFNAFRYSIYDIPYEVIEYPTDEKQKNQKEHQEKLGFDPTWKHVVNVGLFTPRKNQSYIFEIAEELKDYKIKFHFVGNQADNFKFYWEPLMKNKPENCVIWGERNDVDSFLQASDLFLFPSRGDKNNKELNPIAIKEALELNMPMMMFNLDVYCGKYNHEPNINFLTGDLNTDSVNLLKKLNITSKIEIFEPTKKLFWTLDKNGKEELRDLEEENKDFSYEKYNQGLFDSNNFLWKEMFDSYEFDDNGCDYERMGCKIEYGDVVLDIGANIGIFAHRAEQRGASKIYSFEPLTPTFNCLIKNKGEKTEVFKLAVGSVDEFRTFKIHTDFTHIGGATCDPDNTLGDRQIIHEEKVFVIEINKIFENLSTKIDFFKMDVEGSEVEILNSIKDEHLSKIRCFSTEFHCHNEEFEKFQQNFIEKMTNLNFSHFTLYRGDGKLRTISFWKN